MKGLFLEFFDDRHNNRSTSCKEKTELHDFFAENRNKLRTLDRPISLDRILIDSSNTRNNGLMDTNHLMCMHESAGIDINMSENGPMCMILLKDEHKNTIFHEFYTILQCVSSDDSDTFMIEIKCVEDNLKRMLADFFSIEKDRLSWFARK